MPAKLFLVFYITHRLDIVFEQHKTQIAAALVALNVQLSLEIKPAKIYGLMHFPFSVLARILRPLTVLVKPNDSRTFKNNPSKHRSTCNGRFKSKTVRRCIYAMFPA